MSKLWVREGGKFTDLPPSWAQSQAVFFKKFLQIFFFHIGRWREEITIWKHGRIQNVLVVWLVGGFGGSAPQKPSAFFYTVH